MQEKLGFRYQWTTEDAPVPQMNETRRGHVNRLTREEWLSAAAIRPAVTGHIHRYGEIYAAAFSGAPWNDPWRTEDAEIHVRELLEAKTAYGLEYVSEGKVVGLLLGTSMLFHYGRTFEINDLAVDPAYQGRGIAGRLLDRCRQDMKDRGVVELHLITGREGFLPRFYEKHGFSREDEVILMGREL